MCCCWICCTFCTSGFFAAAVGLTGEVPGLVCATDGAALADAAAAGVALAVAAAGVVVAAAAGVVVVAAAGWLVLAAARLVARAAGWCSAAARAATHFCA